MGTEIESSRERTGEDNVFQETDHEHTHELAEKPAGVPEIIRAQIDRRFAKPGRKREGRKEIEHDRLKQEGPRTEETSRHAGCDIQTWPTTPAHR